MSAAAAVRSSAAVVVGDFRRRVVSRGHDARGAFAILECQHKIRKHADDATDTHRWCKSCENRSPYR